MSQFQSLSDEEQIEAAFELIGQERIYKGAHSMKIVGKDKAKVRLLKLLQRARLEGKLEELSDYILSVELDELSKVPSGYLHRRLSELKKQLEELNK